MSTSARPLSSLVRLRPLTPAQLPAHPSLPDSSSSSTITTVEHPNLTTFTARLLSDADTFLSTHHRTHRQPLGRPKPSPPSLAPVTLTQLTIPPSHLPPPHPTEEPEHWFGRTSEHCPATATKGTASWAEFEHGLRVQHSVHEMAYTPAVYAAHAVLDWAAELEDEQVREALEALGWREVRLQVLEMCHALPPPLAPRCFPVLLASARATAAAAPAFLVVQVPVALPPETPGLLYSNHANLVASATKLSGLRRKKVVVGEYVSIERVGVIRGEGGGGEGEGEEGGMERVKWEMVTASDAKGVLPLWMQRLALPGKIAKDVGLFLAWVDKQRGSKMPV